MQFSFSLLSLELHSLRRKILKILFFIHSRVLDRISIECLLMNLNWLKNSLRFQFKTKVTCGWSNFRRQWVKISILVDIMIYWVNVMPFSNVIANIHSIATATFVYLPEESILSWNIEQFVFYSSDFPRLQICTS